MRSRALRTNIGNARIGALRQIPCRIHNKKQRPLVYAFGMPAYRLMAVRFYFVARHRCRNSSAGISETGYRRLWRKIAEHHKKSDCFQTRHILSCLCTIIILSYEPKNFSEAEASCKSFFRRYDKKCRLKYRRHFLFRVCADVCERCVYVSFR